MLATSLSGRNAGPPCPQDDQALAVLRQLGGTLWVAGVERVGSIPAQNYTSSSGGPSFAAVEAVVGLVVCSASQISPELLTNGDFSSGAGWTTGTGWTIAGGIATFTPGAVGEISQTPGVVLGMSYRFRASITRSAGSLSLRIGSPTLNSSSFSATSTPRLILPALGSDGSFRLVGTSTFAGTVDNLSLRTQSGYHLTQATTANKPVLRRTGNLYRWEFGALATMSTVFPAGFESCTVIDAVPGGQLTVTDQNCVGTYTLGPNLITHARMVIPNAPNAVQLAILQALMNRLAGVRDVNMGLIPYVTDDLGNVLTDDAGNYLTWE